MCIRDSREIHSLIGTETLVLHLQIRRPVCAGNVLCMELGLSSMLLWELPQSWQLKKTKTTNLARGTVDSIIHVCLLRNVSSLLWYYLSTVVSKEKICEVAYWSWKRSWKTIWPIFSEKTQSKNNLNQLFWACKNEYPQTFGFNENRWSKTWSRSFFFKVFVFSSSHTIL